METKVKSPEQIAKPNARVQHGLLWGVLIVVLVGIVVANIWSSLHHRFGAQPHPASSSSAPTVHKGVPDFSLTHQGGAPLTLSDLKGKIWVADFIFTNCPDACPLMTDKMARLQEEFARADVYFVSFSVDPERDTPEVLSRYAERYGANPNKWFFLTGAKEAIYRLAQEGFNLAAGHQGTAILHSSRFVLVDRHGQTRGYYEGNVDGTLQKLRRDIKSLLRSETPKMNK